MKKKKNKSFIDATNKEWSSSFPVHGTGRVIKVGRIINIKIILDALGELKKEKRKK